MKRDLREGFDQLVLAPSFGVLFRDALDARVVAEGLRVELRRRGRDRWARLQASGYGAFAAHDLPWLEASAAGSPPLTSPCGVPFELRVDDPRGRFLPLSLEVELPTAGLYDPGLAPASPPEREPAVPLYTAPTRVLVGAASVRATLRRASKPDAPASWARVELWLDGDLLGEGVADEEGNLLLPCRLPPPREPPLHGSPPAPDTGFERMQWQVELRAFWHPQMSGRVRPDLRALREQPEVALLRDSASPAAPLPPQLLRAGVPLVARSDDSSYLFVGA